MEGCKEYQFLDLEILRESGKIFDFRLRPDGLGELPIVNHQSPSENEGLVLATPGWAYPRFSDFCRARFGGAALPFLGACLVAGFGLSTTLRFTLGLAFSAF